MDGPVGAGDGGGGRIRAASRRPPDFEQSLPAAVNFWKFYHMFTILLYAVVSTLTYLFY